MILLTCPHCKTQVYGVPPLHCTCPVAVTPPSFIAKRFEICRSCEYYTVNTLERCGVLVQAGKPGILDHPRGIRNPKAKCPKDKWKNE